jgi:UDPglucose 6-dehydrogenase
MKVCVLGAGYVGLVTGVCLADLGHDVSVLDVNSDRVELLRAGLLPIVETGLEQLLAKNRAGLTFDTPPAGIAAADAVLIAVGTPSAPGGAANLRYVHEAVELIATEARPGTVVVMKSTVPPGTGRTLEPALSEAGCSYVSNPEFLREGSAIQDFFETDRIVMGGSDPAALGKLRELYRGIETEFVECDVPSAEMIKYASNAFLATKISFINEIANVCGLVGADIDAVARGVGLDQRIGPQFLNAGIGYGGSCFPKDTRALDFLAVLHGYEFCLLKAVIEVNSRQRLLPLRAIEGFLGTMAGRRIVVLGLTFKPYTDDTREAPGIDLVTLLAARGAQVVVHDPQGTLPEGVPAQQKRDVYDALDGAQAAVVAVEWPEYVSIEWTRAATVMAEGALVFDGRNCLSRDQVERAGLRYARVGDPAAS